jgi:hypothetical protein
MNSNIFWEKNVIIFMNSKKIPPYLLLQLNWKKNQSYLNLVHPSLSYLWIEVYLTKTFYEHLGRIYTIKKNQPYFKYGWFFCPIFFHKNMAGNHPNMAGKNTLIWEGFIP